MDLTKISIRPELTSDHDAIYELTKRAFAHMPYAGGDEQDLVNWLRDAGALVLSLVAVHEGFVVGHVAFSPAWAEDGSQGWFALGPVAVSPELQSQGIGALLINEGVACLNQLGAAGCMLTGNPHYYARFGFLPFPHLAPAREPAQYFMILPLSTRNPSSIMAFHPLFYAQH